MFCLRGRWLDFEFTVETPTVTSCVMSQHFRLWTACCLSHELMMCLLLAHSAAKCSTVYIVLRMYVRSAFVQLSSNICYWSNRLHNRWRNSLDQSPACWTWYFHMNQRAAFIVSAAFDSLGGSTETTALEWLMCLRKVCSLRWWASQWVAKWLDS